MTRKIIDYKNLSKELKELLVDSYPKGFSQKAIVSYTNNLGDRIEAVELRTKDTNYLIKVKTYNKLEFEDISESDIESMITEKPDNDEFYDELDEDDDSN